MWLHHHHHVYLPPIRFHTTAAWRKTHVHAHTCTSKHAHLPEHRDWTSLSPLCLRSGGDSDNHFVKEPFIPSLLSLSPLPPPSPPPLLPSSFCCLLVPSTLNSALLHPILSSPPHTPSLVPLFPFDVRGCSGCEGLLSSVCTGSSSSLSTFSFGIFSGS